MKKICILTLAAIAAALFSCEKPAEESVKGVSVNKDLLQFSAQGGELTLELKAVTAWSIEPVDTDWCTVDPSSGTSNATIKITAQPNTSKENGRSGKLEVKYDDKSITVAIAQEKNPEDPVFTISNKSFQIGADGGEFSFTVVSDAADYDITVLNDWITAVSREGDRYTGETLKFSVAPSEWQDPRDGTVSVCTSNGSCIPVMVSQAGSPWPNYVHQNIGFRFTATWCGWCPYLDETFHKLAEKPEYKFNYITFHASSGYPMYLAASGSLANYYNVQYFPTGILNGWKEVENDTDTDANAEYTGELIQQFQQTLPCVAGISVSSAVNGDEIEVSATVKASPGEYSVSAFIIESGIVSAQALYYTDGSSETLTSFVHDNVARKVLSTNVTGDSFTAAQDPVQFNWKTSVNSSWVVNNLSVAVMVMRPFGNYKDLWDKKNKYPDNYIVNSVIVPVGTTKEMENAQ